jgi:hypothetical protein
VAEDFSRPLPSPLPDIVARVNGQAIYLAQVLPLAKAELDRGSVFERKEQTPLVLRRAVREYVERELLFQEALARGVQADTPTVQRAYDQLRREHPDEAEWAEFLAGMGLDARRMKEELRAQHTVLALLDAEIGEVADAAERSRKREEARQRLVERLRARASIDILI